MMFVVYQNEPYEYSEPLAVCSTKRRALNCIKKEGDSSISYGIIEIRLDKGAVEFGNSEESYTPRQLNKKIKKKTNKKE